MALIEITQDELTRPPARQIVLIESTFSDGSKKRGTGVLIGPNDILTAGHVVYSDSRGWMDNVRLWFAPDYNPSTNQLETLGEVVSWTQWTATAWPHQIYASAPDFTSTPQETQFDVALIGIDYPIGADLGYLIPDEGYNQIGEPFEVTAYGYSSGFSGLTFVDTKAEKFGPSANMYTIPEQMFAGASGGPLLTDQDRVIGVVSAGSAASGTQFADLSTVWGELIEIYHQNDSLLPTWSEPSWNLQILEFGQHELPNYILRGEMLNLVARDSHHVADRISISLSGSPNETFGQKSLNSLVLGESMRFGSEFSQTLLFPVNDEYADIEDITIRATFYDDDSDSQATVTETVRILDRVLRESSASQQFDLQSIEYEAAVLIEVALGREKIQEYIAEGTSLVSSIGLQSTIEALVNAGLIESYAGETHNEWVAHVYQNISPPVTNLIDQSVFVSQLQTEMVGRTELLTLGVQTLMLWDLGHTSTSE